MATPTYEPIQTYTLGSAQSTVTFSSIPQTYTDLIIVARTSHDGGSAGSLMLRFNSDTGSSYAFTRMYADGSSAAADRGNNETVGYIAIVGNQAISTAGTSIIQIQNYSNNTTRKMTFGRGSDYDGGYVSLYESLWRNTNAITSIDLKVGSPATFTNFRAGSTFTLYGIASTGATAKATGGFITSDSNYFYHTFLSSGTFTPTQALTVDYLVVAGGGGGGRYKAGGGGAGGLRCTVDATGGGGSLESQLSLTTTAYTVTIGAGGTRGIDGGGGSQDGSNGGNSVFASITATGGGGGGGAYASDNGVGKVGGSGGGGQANTISAGGAGTTNQGFAGADAVSGTGGGGGGAAEAGNTDGTGEGGDGIATSINSVSTYYAGGGGAGSNSATKIGGLGGGGTGGYTTTPTAGTANTGGGGGGGPGDFYGGSNQGANGGSGIVIVRYPKA